MSARDDDILSGLADQLAREDPLLARQLSQQPSRPSKRRSASTGSLLERAQARWDARRDGRPLPPWR